MSQTYDLLERLIGALNQSKEGFNCSISPPSADHPRGLVQVPHYWELSLIHEYWNRVLHAEAWEKWRYWYFIAKSPGHEYSDLRLCESNGRFLTSRNAPEGAVMEVPLGLESLGSLIDYTVWEQTAKADKTNL